MSLHHQALRRQAFLAGLNSGHDMAGEDAVSSDSTASPNALEIFPEPTPDSLIWVSSSIAEPFLTISPREAVTIQP